MKLNIRFDRNELAGAFGDIGTDLPLIIGMILASQLHSGSVLVMFGLMQIMTGMLYGLPMPVQPLKVVALIVISQNIDSEILFGGGLAIGFLMFVLSLTGLVTWLGKVIPKVVIRGIQFGLGTQLCLVSLREYVLADGMSGYLLAGVAFLITIVLLGNRKYPPALFVIALGVIYAFFFSVDLSKLLLVNIDVPTPHVPSWDAIATGFLLLALPQIPLSLGNSIFATTQIIKDYFPERAITVRKIGFTYSVMNLINPFFGGVPVCHGSGGLAGHYTFGARTGGSVILYGLVFLAVGLFFSMNFENVFLLFPKPMLGVILLFEGAALMTLIKDTAQERFNLLLALLVGVIAAGLPYGFLIGMILGTGIYYFKTNRGE